MDKNDPWFRPATERNQTDKDWSKAGILLLSCPCLGGITGILRSLSSFSYPGMGSARPLGWGPRSNRGISQNLSCHRSATSPFHAIPGSNLRIQNCKRPNLVWKFSGRQALLATCDRQARKVMSSCAKHRSMAQKLLIQQKLIQHRMEAAAVCICSVLRCIRSHSCQQVVNCRATVWHDSYLKTCTSMLEWAFTQSKNKACNVQTLT